MLLEGLGVAQTGSLNLACCASAMIIIGAATAAASCAAPAATCFGLGWCKDALVQN